ncbi:hypothetical protein EYF80_032605 [Liparis tanakae]|uniref:Uncharacterized protein n=1 Tax=Liparis tanakae TaxID=230148 RepID=A0A4Z2GVQ4_9TELE|nr:hypothetical protein EYF80_032605 [Liparis tanakae]
MEVELRGGNVSAGCEAPPTTSSTDQYTRPTGPPEGRSIHQSVSLQRDINHAATGQRRGEPSPNNKPYDGTPERVGRLSRKKVNEEEKASRFGVKTEKKV